MHYARKSIGNEKHFLLNLDPKHLKLESEPIGEGTVRVAPTMLYNLKGAIFIGEYGVVYGAVLKETGTRKLWQ